jgi:hypothetical protein
VFTDPSWPTPALHFGPDRAGICHSLLSAHPAWTIEAYGEVPQAVKAGREMPRVAQARPGIVSPAARIVRGLEGMGYAVRRKNSGEWRSKCPYHGGRTPASLSVREFPDGSASVHCFGGCSTEDVLSMIP